MKQTAKRNKTSPPLKRRRINGKAIKAKRVRDTDVQMSGVVELMAGEGKSKEPSLYLVANTGKPMDLNGFDYPVIIDMKGAYFDQGVTPIIVDHETSKRFGHTTDQIVVAHGKTGNIAGRTVKGPLIAARAIRSSQQKGARSIMADAKTKFPFQTSVGAKIQEGYILEEGDTAEVNGRTWSGPLVVSEKTRIREISITVLGADNETSAVVAAKSKEKEDDMEFSKWLEAMGLVEKDLDAKQLKLLKAKHKKEIEAAEADLEDEEEEESTVVRGKRVKAKGKKLITATRGRTIRRTREEPDDDDDDDDTEIDAEGDINLRAAEREERIEGIRDVFDRFEASGLNEIELGEGKKKQKLSLKAAKAKAIKDNWTVDRFELECRRADLPVVRGPGIHIIDNAVSNSKALEASILRYAGIPNKHRNDVQKLDLGLEAMFDAKTLDESHKRQYNIGGSINKLLALQAQAAGISVNHLTSDMDLMAAAHEAWTARFGARGARGTIQADGFSNISVTNILENVMHKAAYTSFAMVEGMWQFICARKPVNDFKVHSLYRLDPQGHFRKVPTDGQLKHVGMTDTKKTLQAETYGAMIAIDRKTQKNDDLGLVLEKARSIGTLGALRVDEAVFVLLLSNPSSFFAAGNGNLMTGGGTALSISSLQTAQQKFRDQLINGKPIAVAPSILLVGTNQEVLSNQLYNQSQMWVTTTADTPKFANNPWAGRFRPYYTGYLNNTSITDQDGLAISGQSTTQWYLFANPSAPQGAALVIGFLDGRETPYFDEAATEFSIPGGIQMRAYFDFGVAMHIPQMALKSAGA